MLFPPTSPGLHLRTRDFYLLHDHFCRQAEATLPVPGTVLFWDTAAGWLTGYRGQKGSEEGKLLTKACAAGRPVRSATGLVIPVGVEEGSHIALVVSDIDPALTARMADEWLLEFQGKIKESLVSVKQDFIHPETGLYSSRLLGSLLGDDPGDAAAFFLVYVQHRTRRASAAMRNMIQTAMLLEATAAGLPVYLGGNLYAEYNDNADRDTALRHARRLLDRLRREGARQVQIGIAVSSAEDRETGQWPGLWEQAWQALETAERRGPFSFCALSSETATDHPLASPSRLVTGRLRKGWQGHDKFGLLLFRQHTKADEDDRGCLLGDTLQGYVQGGHPIVQVSENETAVLMPGMSGKQTARAGRALKRKLASGQDPVVTALGISYWPCLGYTRSETVRNGRRALMHGDFFGPDSVTLFDHVSLNVSGDYFFDEGDYRQAVKDYQAGLELDPGNINLLNSLGVALSELSRHRQAGVCFRQVLDKEPANFMALVNKGFSLRTQGRDQDALFCFEKAARSKKFDGSRVFADVSVQLGRLYCDQGVHRKAVRVLEKLLNRLPTGQRGYIQALMGEALAGAGKDKAAIVALQNAVRQNPHDARSLSILGELYARTGEGTDIAVVLCEKALALEDGPWQYWYRLAQIREIAGDVADAARALREMMRRKPDDRDALLAAAKFFSRLGQKRKVLAAYRRLAALMPDDRETRRALHTLEAQ